MHRWDESSEITKFHVTIAKNCRVLTRCSAVRYERTRHTLFRCILSIVRVMIIFRCGYTKFSTQYKGKYETDYLCVLFVADVVKRRPRHIYHSIIFKIRNKYGEKAEGVHCKKCLWIALSNGYNTVGASHTFT
jgi:hypothetical protein